MLLSRIVIAGSLLTTPAILAAQSAPVPPMHTPPIQTAEVVNSGTLPSDTDVWMRFDQAVDSRTVRQGDKLAMRVSRDVMQGGRVVIPHGTTGHGMVSRRTGKGAFGKSGKLSEPDGTRIEKRQLLSGVRGMDRMIVDCGGVEVTIR